MNAKPWHNNDKNRRGVFLAKTVVPNDFSRNATILIKFGKQYSVVLL